MQRVLIKENRKEDVMTKKDFVLPMERAGMNPVSIMGEEEGIYFTFRSDFGAIARILPEPLEPAFPLVSGYVVEINKPAFAKPYKEAMIGVYVKYHGQIGMYPVSFLLSGEGAEMATLGGRERFGLPKKMCETKDCIQLERDDQRARAIVKRGGVTLLDVSLKLGHYNNEGTGEVYGKPEPGKVSGGLSYYAQPVTEPDGSGFDVFKKINLYTNVAEYTYQTWEPGEVSIRMQSSENDAWGYFPVIENMGGAFSKNDIEMKDLQLAQTIPVEGNINKLLVNRYDQLCLK